MSDILRAAVGEDSLPVIKFKTNFRNTVYDVLRSRGWKETEGDNDWDIIWADKDWIHDEMDHMHLQASQRVNHFRSYGELTRKDLLARNIKKTRRELERQNRSVEASEYLTVIPTTYVLPLEYSMFVEEFKRQRKDTVWIMKPVGKSQGKGIFLFDKLHQISDWKNSLRPIISNQPPGVNSRDPRTGMQVASLPPEAYVVQRYLENPLLIGGKKFDLRIYALVTSYKPLTVWLHRTGFARFSHTQYSKVDASNMSDVGMHLTNVAVQKLQANYDSESGGKWDLNRLKCYLSSKYGREKTNVLFGNIQRLVLMSLSAVQRTMISDRVSFELYGFDVIIDSKLDPWLLEVNASPSLTANTPEDYKLKCDLLDDTFSVVDIDKILTPRGLLTPSLATNANSMEGLPSSHLRQIGGFDLICKDDVQITNYSVAAAGVKTMLGCRNNRLENFQTISSLIRQIDGTSSTPQNSVNNNNSAANTTTINSDNNTNNSTNASQPTPLAVMLMQAKPDIQSSKDATNPLLNAATTANKLPFSGGTHLKSFATNAIIAQ